MAKNFYKSINVLNEDYFDDIEITDKDIQSTADNTDNTLTAETEHIYNHDIIIPLPYDRELCMYNAEKHMLILKHRVDYIFNNLDIIDKYEIQFKGGYNSFPYDFKRYDVGNGIIWWGYKNYIDSRSLEDQYNSIKDNSLANYRLEIRLLFDSTTDNIKYIQKLLLYFINTLGCFDHLKFKYNNYDYRIMSNDTISSLLANFIRYKKANGNIQKIWNTVQYFVILRFYKFIKQFTPYYGISKLRDYLEVNDLKYHIINYSTTYKTVYYEHIDYGYDINKFLDVVEHSDNSFWQYYDFDSDTRTSIPNRNSDLIKDYLYKRAPGINVYLIRQKPSNELYVYYYFDKTFSKDDGIVEYDLLWTHYVYDINDIIKLFTPMYCIGCDVKKAITSTKKIKDDFNGYYILDEMNMNTILSEIKTNINANE